MNTNDALAIVLGIFWVLSILLIGIKGIAEVLNENIE